MEDRVTIPNRFESLQEVFGQNVRPLIVPVSADLLLFTQLRERAKVQGGGLLAFILGPTGIGKTTAVHSASINMPDDFTAVTSVPGNISFRDMTGWLENHIPQPDSSKTTLILFDGREVSDDSVGVKQLLSALNHLLRRRHDIIFCWPTTDDTWHTELKQLSNTIGGTNFTPPECDCRIQGPTREQWPELLDRLLLQFQKTTSDVALDSAFVLRLCANSPTSGDFLTSIGEIITTRIVKTREIKQLPMLLFVISSSGDAIGEANRIRRAGSQSLAPEPMLAYSPRSNAGRWWKVRNQNPIHGLGYIISLFQASLVTLSPSAVSYACGQHGDQDLRALVSNAGTRPDKGNAMRTIQASEFYRFLKKELVPEYTSTRKGAIQPATIKAYNSIQALSASRHKSINQAICRLTAEHLPEMTVPDDQYEVVHEREVVTDAIVAVGGAKYHSEFHHLSALQCRAATMSAYIMDKLRGYAIYHQLIPR